jgi:very-short-patch-repair endonuclease
MTQQLSIGYLSTSDAVDALHRRSEKRAKKQSPEDLFAFHCRSYELPTFVQQGQFAKSIGRKWQFDFSFHEYHLAVEIEGLVVQKLAGQLVVRGRHASISGFKEDCIKYATAATLGWTVLRFEQSQVKDLTAIDFTMKTLQARGWVRET